MTNSPRSWSDDAEALAEYDSILTAIRHLPSAQRDGSGQGRRAPAGKRGHQAAPGHADRRVTRRCRQFIEQNVALFNGHAGRPAQL